MDASPQNGAQAPDDHHGDDQGDTLTPVEAGRVLGVGDERVRQMLAGEELIGRKVAGRWHVYRWSVLDALKERGEPRGPSRGRNQGSRAAGGPDPNRDELVEALKDQVEDLRVRLDAEQEARRRADTIIAQLSQANAEQARTIRAIEAPASLEAAEPPVSPGPTNAPTGTTGGPQTATQGPQGTPQRPSIWRRIFGG